MFQRSTYWVVILLAWLVAMKTSAAPAAPATSWVPRDAVIVVQVPKPRALVDRVFADRVVNAVTALPVYRQQVGKSQFRQLRNLVEYFERRYDTKLPELLSKLLGGGVTWALGPGQRSLLIIEAEDGKMLDEVHDFFLMIARNEAEKEGRADRVVSAEYRGVTGWSFGPREVHAIVDNRLVVCNKPEVLKQVLDLRADGSANSLGNWPPFHQAQKTAGQPDVLVFANLGVLKLLPNVQQALKRSDKNPLATLTFAPFAAALDEANWLSIGARLQQNRFTLVAATDGVPSQSEAPDGFARPAEPDGGALPPLSVPRQIASLSLYRDLHRFYAAKDELFPQRTSELIFFENMMGIFFTGRDLTEQVLAEVEPYVRLVVAEQQYASEAKTPALQLPAFAAVFRMRHPEQFAPVVEEAWQKALGLINFTRGQQALPGLIIDRPTYAGLKYTVASFAPGTEEQVDDAARNFQPTLAMPGPYLILSSTDALARDLIDQVQREAAAGARPLAGTHSVLEISGQQLASILDANRQALIRQNMVEEGKTEEQAARELGIVIEVLRHLGKTRLTAGADQQQSTLSLDMPWQLP